MHPSKLNMLCSRVLLTSVAGAAMLALGATSASAVSTEYYDIDAWGARKIASESIYSHSVSGTLDITLDGIEGDSFSIGWPYHILPRTYADQGGFVPGEHFVVDATMSLFVTDDFDIFRGEVVEVALGGVDAGSYEVDLGDILDFEVSAQLRASINEDGRIEYSVTATDGDLRVHYVALHAVASTLSGAGGTPGGTGAGPHMPEPTAALVFGIGLLVVGAARPPRS